MNTLFKRILCPIDADELYHEALEFSRSIAQQHDAKLYVLTVVSKISLEHGLESSKKARPPATRSDGTAGQGSVRVRDPHRRSCR